MGNLNIAASATLTIVATVNSGTIGTTITNTASVTAVVQQDSITANNSASAAITIEWST